jgi:spermidine synthase
MACPMVSSPDSAPTLDRQPATAVADQPTHVAAVPAGVALFVATTFASAFLIFLVQPLVAKRIVPWFGGVPAVWSLCLAFYQTTLFAGYAYAYLLIARANPRVQLVLHAAAIAAAIYALPVLPSDAWRPDGGGDPSAQILAILLANVALPFFALAATGPLVAVWFSRRYPARSPYPLYAVSNLGSLVALVAYPFAVEPRLPLSITGRLWSGAFAATGAAVVACAWLSSRSQAAAPDPAAEVATAAPRGRIALWVLLSACAVVLLMGITNYLCLDIASVPFLWIVPLATYLATLIACFGAPRVYRRVPFALLAATAYGAESFVRKFELGAATLDLFGGMVLFHVAQYVLLLLAACMMLHGELYRLRPPARSLTAFYLCTSGGGALGGLAVGLVAPRVFDGFYEMPIGLALAGVLVLLAFRDDTRGFLARGGPTWRWALVVPAVATAIGYAGMETFQHPPNVIHQERSFFGVLRIEKRRTAAPQALPARVLVHGSTQHGMQVVGNETTPTSYYGIHTGIGIALARPEPAQPARIGVIGLGTGTLATYGRAGDHIQFFEIDPAVVHLSRDAGYFTYLEQSKAEVEVVLGDGRISLAREREQNAPRFDYLIVDAYSSDAVPLHLLTREAIALYLDSLQPDGLLAIHTSSRHFDLLPVLARLAEEAHLSAASIEALAAPKYFSGGASWVFLARDAARIDALAKAGEQRRRALGFQDSKRPAVRRATRAELASAPLWTDDYSDLYRALAPNGSAVERPGLP